MATQSLQVADVLGLTPAIDPTRSDKFFVLKGKNFLFDAIGPRSGFGNRLLSKAALLAAPYIQGIRLKLRSGDRSFTITTNAILEWNEATLSWTVIYATPDTSVQPYRWTWGYLAGKVYFCHPRTGIIVYDVETGVAALLAGPGVPTNAIAIVVNNGRLCVMTDELFAWSAQSDGSYFKPELGGAGFQRIDSRVPGLPIMISTYAKGVLIWTTGGVMRSEFTGDVEVWRHRNLNTEYRPVNSFCTVRVDDDTVIILDERGLFQSKGEIPTAFAPLFNEFLIDYLQRNNVNVGENVRLEWDELQRVLYVSVSLSYANPLYEECFVLYPPTDKWGQFGEAHYGILPIKITGSERADDYYGFADSDGFIRYWKRTGSREIVANVEDPNAAPVLQGLDAYIWIGLLRGISELDLDHMTEIIQIMVRSNQSGPEDRTILDFAIEPDLDLNIPGSDLNLGFEELNYVNHQLKIISTNDGQSEFQSAVPDLVNADKAARLFACSTVGIWHIVEIRAAGIGEAFHIRTLELTAADAGRLT